MRFTIALALLWLAATIVALLWFRGAKQGLCHTCDGTGVVTKPLLPGTCPHCHGSGQEARN